MHARTLAATWGGRERSSFKAASGSASWHERPLMKSVRSEDMSGALPVVPYLIPQAR